MSPLLVLEDDAFPLKAFVSRTQQALDELRVAGEDPALLYLGYTRAAPLRRRVGKAVWEAECLWTTVGYIVWPNAARKLLGALPIDQPVDSFLAALTSSGRLRAFAVTPAVLRQAKAWNVDNAVLGHVELLRGSVRRRLCPGGKSVCWVLFHGSLDGAFEHVRSNFASVILVESNSVLMS